MFRSCWVGWQKSPTPNVYFVTPNVYFAESFSSIELFDDSTFDIENMYPRLKGTATKGFKLDGFDHAIIEMHINWDLDGVNKQYFWFIENEDGKMLISDKDQASIEKLFYQILSSCKSV